MFQFVPVSSDLVLSLGITEKRLALSVCFTPSVQVIVQINRQVLQSLCLGLQACPVCRQCWPMSYWVLCSAAGWLWSFQVSARVVQEGKGEHSLWHIWVTSKCSDV